MSGPVRWARSGTDGLQHAYRGDRQAPLALCGAVVLTGTPGIGPGHKHKCTSCERLLLEVPGPQFGAGSEWPGLTRHGGGIDGER